MNSSTDSPPLRLTSTVGIVISSMIGVGLYTTSGFALSDLHSPFLVLLAWGIGGLLALCGAIAYGALATRFAQSGGEYLYLSKTLHPAAGSVAGVVSMIAGFTGAMAISALTFETCLLEIAGQKWSCPHGLIATAVIGFAAIQHLFRVRLGIQLQTAVVLMKLVLLIVFLLVAASLSPERWAGSLSSSSEQTDVSLAVFATSLMWITFSYCGFNAAIYCADEVQHPERTIPRAMLVGTAVVTLFYLLMNAVFVLAPPSEQIAGQQQIATIAARYVAGDHFAILMGFTIALSLYTSVSAMTLTGPRVYAKMADDGILPKIFRFQKDAPKAGILCQAVAAILIVHMASLQQLLTYLGFTLSVSAALSVGMLIWHSWKIREPKLNWWQTAASLIYVVTTLLIAYLSASRYPLESLWGLSTLVAGLILYGVRRREFS